MTDRYDLNSDFRSGYVSITGAPNAGKSTLLNRMLGEKISITSKKPQTTRNRILGVLHRPEAQMVFFDTPGVFQAKDKLNTRIVDTALSAAADADLILFVIDVSQPDTEAGIQSMRQIRLVDDKCPACTLRRGMGHDRHLVPPI